MKYQGKSNNGRQMVCGVLRMLRLSWQAYPWAFLILISIQTAYSVIPVVHTWITKYVLDTVVQSIESSTFDIFVYNVLPLLIIQMIINVTTNSAGHISGFLQAELTRKLKLNTKIAFFGLTHQFDKLDKIENTDFSNKLKLTEDGIERNLPQALDNLLLIFKSLLLLVSFLSVIFVLSPALAILLIVVCIPQIVSQFKLAKRRLAMMWHNVVKERQISYFENVITSLVYAKELRLFNIAGFFIEKYQRLRKETNESYREQQKAELKFGLVDTIFNHTISSLCFIYVVFEAFQRHITVGDITFYMSALITIQSSLSNLIFVVPKLREGVRFFTYYDELQNQAIEERKAFTSSRSIPPLQEGIELRHVSFRYDQNHSWVLKDVNLFLQQGKCLALVGKNGAGKSTLIKLLSRLYDPTEGEILWDGIDIRHFDIQELRRKIGVIMQDFCRFELTIKENIGLGRIEELNNDQLIHMAAKKTGVDKIVNTFPQSYNTILSRSLFNSDQGIDLSGGQWQKIAIARMFMRDADMFILDEPTSSLDPQAEYEISEQFVELVKNRTSLLVSHRLSTVKLADLIAVIEDGHLIEYGSHNDLFGNSSAYTKLYEVQPRHTFETIPGTKSPSNAS